MHALISQDSQSIKPWLSFYLRICYRTLFVKVKKAPSSRECFLKNRSKLQMTIMVAEVGFEPTTSRLWASRAARLLYSAVCPPRDCRAGVKERKCRSRLHPAFSQCHHTTDPICHLYSIPVIARISLRACPCKRIICRHEYRICTATSSHVLSLT